MNKDDAPILNEKELVEYIFDKLVAEGIAVTREDIVKVLDYEMDYMVENGFAEVIEDEEVSD